MKIFNLILATIILYSCAYKGPHDLLSPCVNGKPGDQIVPCTRTPSNLGLA